MVIDGTDKEADATLPQGLPPDNDFTQKNQRKKSMLKSRLDVLPCCWMKKKILPVQQEKNGAEYERSKL